jgi:hypothetical protein
MTEEVADRQPIKIPFQSVTEKKDPVKIKNKMEHLIAFVSSIFFSHVSYRMKMRLLITGMHCA